MQQQFTSFPVRKLCRSFCGQLLKRLGGCAGEDATQKKGGVAFAAIVELLLSASVCVCVCAWLKYLQFIYKSV